MIPSPSSPDGNKPMVCRNLELFAKLAQTRCTLLYEAYMTEVTTGRDLDAPELIFAMEGPYEGLVNMEAILLKKHLKKDVRRRNEKYLTTLFHDPLTGVRIWNCDGHVIYSPGGFKVVPDIKKQVENKTESVERAGNSSSGENQLVPRDGPFFGRLSKLNCLSRAIDILNALAKEKSEQKFFLQILRTGVEKLDEPERTEAINHLECRVGKIALHGAVEGRAQAHQAAVGSQDIVVQAEQAKSRAQAHQAAVGPQDIVVQAEQAKSRAQAHQAAVGPQDIVVQAEQAEGRAQAHQAAVGPQDIVVQAEQAEGRAQAHQAAVGPQDIVVQAEQAEGRAQAHQAAVGPQDIVVQAGKPQVQAEQAEGRAQAHQAAVGLQDIVVEAGQPQVQAEQVGGQARPHQIRRRDGNQARPAARSSETQLSDSTSTVTKAAARALDTAEILRKSASRDMMEYFDFMRRSVDQLAANGLFGEVPQLHSNMATGPAQPVQIIDNRFVCYNEAVPAPNLMQPMAALDCVYQPPYAPPPPVVYSPQYPINSYLPAPVQYTHYFQQQPQQYVEVPMYSVVPGPYDNVQLWDAVLPQIVPQVERIIREFKNEVESLVEAKKRETEEAAKAAAAAKPEVVSRKGRRAPRNTRK